MLGAHLGLLKAELALSGKQLGIIAGLGGLAVALLFLALLLVYIGSCLFFGELLFGSMGWGILHGTLLNAVIIGGIAVDLAGGSMRRYGWGVVIGIVMGVLTAAVLATNALPHGAASVAGEAERSIALARNFLATLAGLAVGALALAIVGGILGWRREMRGRPLIWVIVAAAVVGAIIGAIVGSTLWSYAGAAAIGVSVGLLSMIIVGLLLAYQHGFDPEARYAGLVPQRSIDALEESRDLVKAELKRQKDRMMGR